MALGMGMQIYVIGSVGWGGVVGEQSSAVQLKDKLIGLRLSHSG